MSPRSAATVSGFHCVEITSSPNTSRTIAKLSVAINISLLKPLFCYTFALEEFENKRHYTLWMIHHSAKSTFSNLHSMSSTFSKLYSAGSFVLRSIVLTVLDLSRTKKSSLCILPHQQSTLWIIDINTQCFYMIIITCRL